MTSENKKRYLGLLAALLGLGLLKLYSPNADMPPSSGDAFAEDCALNKVALNTEGQKRCDIFNQTDADMLMQQDNGEEVLFAGCGGLF